MNDIDWDNWAQELSPQRLRDFLDGVLTQLRVSGALAEPKGIHPGDAFLLQIVSKEHERRYDLNKATLK